jgi:hypothetical protein
MELSTADCNTVQKLCRKLDAAKQLTTSLELSDYVYFTYKLLCERDFFPSTVEKLASFRKKELQNLKPSQKDALKQTLEAETEKAVQEVKGIVKETKTLHGKRLPADPQNCVRKLTESMARSERKIKVLEIELGNMHYARKVLEWVQTADAFAQQMPRAKKRQRVF